MLHSIGMSPNVRKGRTYDDLDYDYLQKTLDISGHLVPQGHTGRARKKGCAQRVGARSWRLSYIAAQRTLYGYNDMADAKALLESIARSFGYIYGREKHVRINTVSQSPTPTTAGRGVLGMGELMEFAESMSPLGNASAEECADYVLDALFSDFTRKVTMQNLYHDGGFSSMGMSRRAMRTLRKGPCFRGRVPEPPSLRRRGVAGPCGECVRGSAHRPRTPFYAASWGRGGRATARHA